MDYEVGVRLALILDNQKAADEKMDELLAAIRKLANASVEKVNQDVVYEAAPERPPKPRPPIEKPKPLPPRKPPRRYDDEENDEEIDDDDDSEEL